MFVVQLTNTSLTIQDTTVSTTSIVQNIALVVSLSVLLTVAGSTIGSDLLLNVVTTADTSILSTSSYGYPLQSTLNEAGTLGLLASSIFNEHGYILILSVHAIVLAVIGPIKLALANYLN